jgi:hypothetical protein
MSLHTGIAAKAYCEPYGKNSCPQCSERQLAPTRSEYLNECCVRRAWSCEACGHEFETVIFFSGAT